LHVSKYFEDPIATLMEYTASMSKNVAFIPWNANVFGRENELSLYIYKSDLMEIISDKNDLNVSILQLWIM